MTLIGDRTDSSSPSPIRWERAGVRACAIYASALHLRGHHKSIHSQTFPSYTLPVGRLYRTILRPALFAQERGSFIITRPAEFPEPDQGNHPTGKSILNYRIRVKPKNQKMFRFYRSINQCMNPPVSPDKRGARDRHERAVGCGGRRGYEDERG